MKPKVFEASTLEHTSLAIFASPLAIRHFSRIRTFTKSWTCLSLTKYLTFPSTTVLDELKTFAFLIHPFFYFQPRIRFRRRTHVHILVGSQRRAVCQWRRNREVFRHSSDIYFEVVVRESSEPMRYQLIKWYFKISRQIKKTTYLLKGCYIQNFFHHLFLSPNKSHQARGRDDVFWGHK